MDSFLGFPVLVADIPTGSILFGSYTNKIPVSVEVRVDDGKILFSGKFNKEKIGDMAKQGIFSLISFSHDPDEPTDEDETPEPDWI